MLALSTLGVKPQLKAARGSLHDFYPGCHSTGARNLAPPVTGNLDRYTNRDTGKYDIINTYQINSVGRSSSGSNRSSP